jgi:hypothetical protein
VRDVPQTKLKGGADLVLYVNDEGQKQPLLVTWLYGPAARQRSFDRRSPRPPAGPPGPVCVWSQPSVGDPRERRRRPGRRCASAMQPSRSDLR